MDSAVARHQELLTSSRRVVKAREEVKDKVADTLVKLRNIYDWSGKVTVDAHVAEWGDLKERMPSLTNDLERKKVKL